MENTQIRTEFFIKKINQRTNRRHRVFFQRSWRYFGRRFLQAFAWRSRRSRTLYRYFAILRNKGHRVDAAEDLWIRKRQKSQALSSGLGIANDSEHGLAGAVYSKDAERAKKVALAIETGQIFINQPSSAHPELPFGGIKNFGFGREMSDIGLFEFANEKIVVDWLLLNIFLRNP